MPVFIPCALHSNRARSKGSEENSRWFWEVAFWCVSLVYFALSASLFFQHMRRVREGKKGEWRRSKQTYHTSRNSTGYNMHSSLHDYDKDPKTAFFWDMLVGYHRQINMHWSTRVNNGRASQMSGKRANILNIQYWDSPTLIRALLKLDNSNIISHINRRRVRVQPFLRFL